MAVEITRTPSSNGNQKIWTWSGWIKKATVGMGSGDYQMLFTANIGSGSRYTDVFFREDYFEVFGGVYSTSTTTVDINVSTNRKFRDPSAFYHLVVAVDTTQATASNRVKIYVNGVQETSLKNYQGSSVVYPAQNNNTFMNVTTAQNRIGASGGSYPFKGLMTHVHFVDGTAYDASTFGETDSTSGIWTPKTNPSVTYGTNGFFLKFENSGNMDLDSSGNNLTFSTSGTLTQNVDTPTNNFVTFNPLRPNSISQTYSNGNNTFIRTGTGGQMNGTLGVTSGKWYYECLLDDYWQYLGWTALPLNTSQTAACSASGSGFYGLYSNASEVYTYANGSNTSQGSYTAMASGQFWGIAFDADNAKMYFSVNGVWENSSNPANQTNPAMSSIPVTDFLVPAIGQGTGSRSSTIKLNFGSGYFGTTVAGTNADANGHGKFKYSVPSGYYTLNTKNLKEFG